jgi:hypothetical protein
MNTRFTKSFIGGGDGFRQGGFYKRNEEHSAGHPLQGTRKITKVPVESLREPHGNDDNTLSGILSHR